MNNLVKKTKTHQQKAIAVAEDVIKRLKFLRLREHDYISGELPSQTKVSEKDDLKKHVSKVEKYCDVCAIGACILSKAKLYDKLSITDIAGRDHVGNPLLYNPHPREPHRLLDDCFDLKTIYLIEIAFEGESYTWSMDNTTQEQRDNAIAFGDQYPDVKNRVKAIMENIIENKGYFIPPERN